MCNVCSIALNCMCLMNILLFFREPLTLTIFTQVWKQRNHASDEDDDVDYDDHTTLANCCCLTNPVVQLSCYFIFTTNAATSTIILHL